MEIRVQKAYCDPRLGNIDIPCPLAVSVSSCHPQPHHVPLSLPRWLGFVRSLIDRNTFSPLLPSLSLAARASAHSPPSDNVWCIKNRIDLSNDLLLCLVQFWCIRRYYLGYIPSRREKDAVNRLTIVQRLLYIFRSLVVVTKVMSALHKENLGHFVFAKKTLFSLSLGRLWFHKEEKWELSSGRQERCATLSTPD